MNLLNLFRNSNINEYTSIKSLLEREPYNLIVKDIQHFPNLYMIVYDKNNSDLNNSVVKECRGIILEKNTNKIVCYSFNKGLNLHNNLLPNQFDWNSTKVEKSIDGTQIKMFFYDGEWRYASTRCIDANRAYWYTNESFYDLFTDVKNEIDYNRLNEKYCYSFVLCHPKNRIVMNYDEPKLYHVLTRDLETLEEVDIDIGVEKPEVFTNFETFEDLLNSAANSESMEEGYMLCYKDCDNILHRVKIKNESYNKIKKLRGNTNNLFYNFLQLRSNDLLQLYLTFYPEHSSRFALFELDIRKLASEIHHLYMNKHVHRVETNIPSHLRTMIYKLHGSYLDTHEITTINKVVDNLCELHPSQVCHMYNKTFGYHTD